MKLNFANCECTERTCPVHPIVLTQAHYNVLVRIAEQADAYRISRKRQHLKAMETALRKLDAIIRQHLEGNPA